MSGFANTFLSSTVTVDHTDIVGAEGLVRRVTPTTYETIETNLTAVVNPGVNDDSLLGYAVGSVWVNTVTNRVFICADATVGAAVWGESSEWIDGGVGTPLYPSEGIAKAVVIGALVTVGGELFRVVGGALFDGTVQVGATGVVAGSDSQALQFGGVTSAAARNIILKNEADVGTDTYRLRIEDDGSNLIGDFAYLAGIGSVWRVDNTGLSLRDATDTEYLSLVPGGTLTVSNLTTISSSAVIQGPVGGFAAPTYSFSGDTDTGIAWGGTGAIYFFSDASLMMHMGPENALHLIQAQWDGGGGPPYLLRAEGATHGAAIPLPAGSEVLDVDIDLDRTVTFAAGAMATQRAFLVRAPTYAFSGPSTLDEAATFTITGAPAEGANATITTPMALWVQSGGTRFLHSMSSADPQLDGWVNAFESELTGGAFVNSHMALTGRMSLTGTATHAGYSIGVLGTSRHSSTGAVDTLLGSGGIIEVYGPGIATGVVTMAAAVAGIHGYEVGNEPLSGSILKSCAVLAGSPTGTSVARTISSATGAYVLDQGGVGITEAVGIDIEAQTVSATLIGIRTQSPVVIGASALIGTESLYVSGSTRLTQSIATSGTPQSGILFTGGAHTTLTAAEAIDADFNFARNVQFTTGGAIAAQRAMLIQAPTYTATAATQTLTAAATLAISGPPVVGANVAITNAYALWVQSGSIAIGTAPLSGATAVAATGGLRMQGNGAVEGRIVFRNAADGADVAGLSLQTLDGLYLGGPYPVRPANIAADAVTGLYWMLGGATQLLIATSYISFVPSSLYWSAGTVAPSLTQTVTTVDEHGDDLTIGAQGCTNAAGGKLSGSLGLRGGIATGTNKHGNVWLHVVPASWQTGEKVAWLADCVTAPTAVQAGGSFLWSQAGAVATLSPLQLGKVATSGAGSAAATGGLRLQGNGAVQGRIVFRNAADGADVAGFSCIAGDILYVGGLYPTRPVGVKVDASAGHLQSAGASVLYWDATSVRTYQITYMNAAVLYFGATQVAPAIKQEESVTTNDTADDLTIAAQDINTTGAGTGYGGDLGLRGGIATSAGGATNKHGNAWFHVAPASWNTMEKGVFIADCVTAPTGNPTSGLYEFASSGALKVRGSGGSQTTLAPAGITSTGIHDRVDEGATIGAGGTANLLNYTLADGQCAHVRCSFLARDATNGDTDSAEIIATFERTGASVARVSVTTPHLGQEDATWTFDLIASGTTIVAQIVGDAANSVVVNIWAEVFVK
jgi:hypothetical protein